MSLSKNENETLTDAEDIATAFNNYFSTTGEKLAKNIENQNNFPFTHFLKNRLSSSIYLNPPCFEEVYAELCSLNFKKIYRTRRYPTYLVKLAAPFLTRHGVNTA